MSPSTCSDVSLRPAAHHQAPLHILMRAIAIVIAIVACCVAAACPRTALAEPETITVGSLVPNPYSYGGTGHFIRTNQTDSPVAYCAQGWLIIPQEGQVLERHGAIDIPELDYVMYHGYDGVTVTSVLGLDEERSEAATTAAVWLAIGEQCPEILNFAPNNGEPFHGNKMYLERWQRLEDEQVKNAAKELYDQAVAYREAGAGGDEADCAIIWLNHTIYEVDNNYSYQALVTAEKRVTVSFEKASSNPSLTDGNAAYSLEGASYDIFLTESEERVGSISTDENGHTEMQLKPNTSYYAVETAAPAGYSSSEERIPFETALEPTTVELLDDPLTFSFKLIKKDAATGGAAQPGASLEGATYTLTSTSTAGFTSSGTTDAEGRIVFDGIPLGSISVVETAASPGYALDTTEHTYEVSAEDVASGTPFTLSPADSFYETPIAFDIELVKTLDSGQEAEGEELPPAEGVTFQIVSNTTNEVVGTMTTDADGHASTAGTWMGDGERPDGAQGSVPYDAAGYTVREDPATVPAGATPLDNWTIGADEMIDGTTLRYAVTNTVVTSQLTIVKTDEESGMPVKLAGFTFTILDADGQPVGSDAWYPTAPTDNSFTTDETGWVTLPSYLRSGTYRIRETSAPAPYIVAQQDTELVIDEGMPKAVVTVSDRPATGAATFTKTCSADNQPLEGAEYRVVAQEDIVDPTGAVRATAGQTMGQVTTGADGTARIEGLPLGSGTASYAFVETKAPIGHALATAPLAFTVSYIDQETPVVGAQVASTNEPTGITITKVAAGEGGQALKGAQFRVVPADEAVSEEDATAESPTDGTDSSNDTATEPDAESAQNDEQAEPQTAALRTQDQQGGSATDEELDQTASDDESTGEGDATTDETTEPETDSATESDDNEPVEDAPSDVYTTDEHGTCTVLHLEPGTYRIEEVASPEGYIKSLASGPTFEVSPDGLIEGQPHATFTIENDTTKVDISKRSSADESFIAGAQLALLDSEGWPIESWTSEAAPHRIEGLAPGEYILAEETAPREYDEATEIAFTVEETSEVQSVTMHDDPISISATIDKRQEQLEEDTRAGREVSYCIDFRNTSSTWVDEFTVTDEIEAATNGSAYLEGIITPRIAGDRDGVLNVWYRTDAETSAVETSSANATYNEASSNPWLDDETVLNGLGKDRRALDYNGWHLWRESVNADNPTSLTTSNLPLQGGEHITAIRLEYGAVDADFATRIDLWDRSDLHDEGDSVADVQEAGQSTALIVKLKTSEAFSDGAELANTARVDAFRNGGGVGLETHDSDRVRQGARTTLWDLDQTGVSIGGFLFVAATATGAGIWSMVRSRRIRPVPTRRRRW